jgi:hypothetical protein
MNGRPVTLPARGSDMPPAKRQRLPKAGEQIIRQCASIEVTSTTAENALTAFLHLSLLRAG